jgi:hypothetical protein
MKLAVLTYDDCPPSLNTMATAHWRRYQRVKQRWQGIWEVHLLTARVPKGLTIVKASAILQFPHERRRDEGNFRFILEKTLGDALTKGGHLPDDTPDHYRFMGVTFEKGDAKRTILTLEYE